MTAMGRWRLQKEGYQEVLEGHIKWELEYLLVCWLSDGSESLVGSEEAGRTQGFFKKLGYEGEDKRLGV